MPASDGLLFVPIAGYFSSRRFLYVLFRKRKSYLTLGYACEDEIHEVVR